MSHADVTSGQKAVLDAIRAGAETSADLRKATGLDRHRIVYAVNALREAGKVRRHGKGRRKKYSVT